MNPTPRYQFGPFTLDTEDRQLWKDGERLDVNARYLDALILLIQRSPQLVAKDHFFDTVWNDVVVSDNALSQCIKELRKVLDDDAGSPRFIQTVPRHGYRFVGDVTTESGDPDGSSSDSIPPPAATEPAGEQRPLAPLSRSGTRMVVWWAAWAAGGALAGLIGGILYGFGLSSPDAGVGTLSTLMVLIALNVLVGFAGGAGIGAGWVAGWSMSERTGQGRAMWLVIGSMLGGLVTGGAAKMLGLDAFNLLFGRAPADMTGSMEGAALGLAVASGMLLGERFLHGPRISQRMAGSLGAGIVTGLAGLTISLLGGHLMGGSLKSLASSFSESRLLRDSFAPLFGQLETGLWAEVALAGMEGLIFGACLVGLFGWARRKMSDK